MELFKFTYNLLEIKGVGRVKANKILSLIESHIKNKEVEYEKVYDILKPFLNENSITSLFEKKILKNEIESVKYSTIIDKDYPSSLKLLNRNSPTIISYIGNIDLLNKKKIGFCGSRKASDKGLSIAQDISQQVSYKDITVVSGYASGIDQKTHYESLCSGGSTIIVLPMGINHFKIKKYLKNVWDWNRVLVISEFLVDAIWSVSRAMQRNATIIALSDIMVLIEAREKGGSIDAGYKALNLNKPLFAPVYEGLPEVAKGNQILLEKGALPLKKKRETLRANLDSIYSYLKKEKENESLFSNDRNH
ncbi:DNA-processing protein DprA [uncultured Tenacibaculum sp.]|uniref:DNA-processing protein DprA n=1 Tax=uncultured Tenacibaculum sp. TaxID=174713 RepID=UPI00261018A6|nr:DNA-processing protein DprA [uncultured Tenacibaculum sp.]